MQTTYYVHDDRLPEPHKTSDTERAERLSRSGLRVTAESRRGDQ